MGFGKSQEGESKFTGDDAIGLSQGDDGFVGWIAFGLVGPQKLGAREAGLPGRLGNGQACRKSKALEILVELGSIVFEPGRLIGIMPWPAYLERRVLGICRRRQVNCRSQRQEQGLCWIKRGHGCDQKGKSISLQVSARWPRKPMQELWISTFSQSRAPFARDKLAP